MTNLKIRTISKLVHEISGVSNGKFIKRQYIGYTAKQAIKLFTDEIRKEEI